MGSLIKRRRFTADEYQCMARAGILLEDERVELIEGEILLMSPIGRRHAARVNLLNHWFVQRVGDRAIVSPQNPVRLSPHSEPQPDLLLLKFRQDFYESQLPSPEDVLLLIEISETSSAYDRRIKLPRYAAAGILEVWLLEIRRRRVGVHREPSPQGYGSVEWLEAGAELAPAALPDLVMRVDEMLGPRDNS